MNNYNIKHQKYGKYAINYNESSRISNNEFSEVKEHQTYRMLLIFLISTLIAINHGFRFRRNNNA